MLPVWRQKEKFFVIIFKLTFLVFICSVKFLNKIQYVHSLDELAEIVPMEHVHVPECIVQ